MKILFAHNYYQYGGGEDVVFAAERDLLREYGHEVIEFTAHNDDVNQMNRPVLAMNTLWSRRYYREIQDVIAREGIDIAHFHNTFMLLSPAVYHACQRKGVPVVQTLHNYRLICPSSNFYRDGHVCEDCMGKFFPYPGMQHGCYRDSQLISGVVAGMLAMHRAVGTWKNAVNRYIALTDFGRQKFIQSGLPATRITVKPNFLQRDPGVGEHQGGYMLFVGRLTEEKGIMPLLEAWKSLPEIPLKVVGDGPLLEDARQFVATHQLDKVEIMGRQKRDDTLNLMKDAYSLVFPSVWYEGMPMTIIEAYATQMPVIASDVGAVATVVEHGETGLRFAPGNPQALAQQVRTLWQDPQQASDLGRTARQVYEENYTPTKNYALLSGIYNEVISEKNRHPSEG